MARNRATSFLGTLPWLALVAAAGCAEAHGTRPTDGGGRDSGSDAALPDGGPFCTAQDATGTGACATVVGVRWNGRTCSFISGCDCQGSDCDELAADLAGCYEDRGRLCFGCGPMAAERARPCGPAEDPAPRWRWTGTGCEQVFWCECAGGDCDRLFNEEAHCLAAYQGCPVPAPASP